MDEDQAFYGSQDEHLLHRYRCSGAAILGLGDLRQLHIFQQYQRHLLEDKTL